MSKKVTLPSGKILEISLASFSEANALNKGIAKSLKQIKLDMNTDLLDADFIKNLFCESLISDEIEQAMKACFKRCLYDNKKITDDLFEDEDARGDYFFICKEVIWENIRPFVKSLLSLSKGLDLTTIQK